MVNRKHKFYIEIGYAIPTGGEKPYSPNDGVSLSEEGELILQIIRPGGIILAFGFMIRL